MKRKALVVGSTVVAVALVALFIAGAEGKDRSFLWDFFGFVPANSVELSDEGVSADATDRKVTLRIPFDNRVGEDVAVAYEVRIRNLKGRKVAWAAGTTRARAGSGILAVRVPGWKLPESVGEQMDFVIDYAIESGGRTFKGKKSLFYLLPKPFISATLPERAFAGTPTTIPVRLADAFSGQPLAGQAVTVAADLEGDKTKNRAVTDRYGVAAVRLAGLKKGSAKVTARADLDSGAAMIEANVDVAEQSRIFLSTDKPLYQPGQTIHIRALVLERPNMKPAAGDDALVEVFDPKGNKVFKEVGKTNAFGIVSAKFTLASQINMGSYRLLLTTGDNQTEKTVNVSRYVLPKFKVSLKLDKDFYSPSQDVQGNFTARYFFGKPVANGRFTATFHDYQAQWVVAAVVEGTTDAEGVGHFTWKLPSRLVGQPVAAGNAMVLLELQVQDTAGQTVAENRQVVVATSAIEATLFPESGTFVPGVENRFFLALSQPGGLPASGNCKVEFSGRTNPPLYVPVSESGLATLSFAPPKGTTSLSVRVRADADSGASVDRSFQFAAASTDAAVLVRPSKSIVRAGEQIMIEVLAAGAVSDAYLDITKDSQTLTVATVPLNHGKGAYSLDVDPAMAGTLALSAYVLSERGEYTRDSRVIFVQEASELTVAAKLDQDQYLPGAKAKVDFHVSAQGQGATQAALGIHVVDEAVFALSESKPGLLRLFFALEEELLKTSFQVGPLAGQTLGSLIQTSAAPEGEKEDRSTFRQTAAEAAIAAQGDVALARQTHSSWPGQRNAARQKIDNYAAFLRERIKAAALEAQQCPTRGWESLPKAVGKILKRYRTDPWGGSTQASDDEWTISLYSKGPDGQDGTWDDFSLSLSADEICPYRERHRPSVLKMMMVEGAMGGGGRGGGDWGAMPEAALMEDRAFMREEEKAKAEEPATSTSSDKEGGEEVRVRKWFPETLLVEDCLVTDENGNASLEFPLADSITSWRMSTVASDLAGRIGGLATPIVVFQDFFVDVDFPVFLTRNDAVEFPVVVYNYLDREQQVEIRVEPGKWFDLMGKSEAKLRLSAGEVASIRFPVRVKEVGWHALTVYGKAIDGGGGKGFADAVQRTVQVRPDGEERVMTAGGKFKTARDGKSQDSVALDLEFPREAIAGSPQVIAQVLPGLTSHVVQGMDSMLRLPGG
jgi:5-hydroxyisourate hydrolase-like protein (transthyretin family)